METLTSFSTKIFTTKNNYTNKSPPSGTLMGRSGFHFPRSLYVSEHLHDHQQKQPQLVVSSHYVASDAKVLTSSQSSQPEKQKIWPRKAVHVKFQLQRECMFGEQFLLVGNAPSLGMWDPSNAIPLTWSDGHIWTADIDVPVELSFVFKFILKQSTGYLLWQPGPDRIFRTWETSNTIIIEEDWENAEFQKLTEDNVMFSGNVANNELITTESTTYLAEDHRPLVITDKEHDNIEEKCGEDEVTTLFRYDEEGPVLVPGLNLTPVKAGSSKEALLEENEN